MSYFTLQDICQSSLLEKQSRFLAFVVPIQNEEDAQEYIRHLRSEYYDSTHVCWALRLPLSPSGELERVNDDGEPSASAGFPILNALRSKNMVHVLAAVVRYYGGTPLGFPGLVKAYRSVVAQALDTAISVPFRVYKEYSECIDISLFDSKKYLIQQKSGFIVSSVFRGKEVDIVYKLPEN